jgi:type II secretory pathway pseudopilin PulG
VIELLVVLTIMILLGGLLLPALTRSKVKAAKAGCASNMKQVTLAFIVWVNDREKDVLPWRVDVADGGTRNHPSGLQNNAWFQYSWISNELPNPRVLACPSDRQAKPADTFDAAPDGGFLSPAYKNEACSYNLGLEGGSRRESSTALPLVPDAEADHEDLLISDRNSNTRPAANGSCSSGLESIHQLTTGDSQWLRQPNYGHGIVGNVALCDGSVLLTRQTELNQLIAKSARENSAVHWLQPRPSP